MNRAVLAAGIVDWPIRWGPSSDKLLSLDVLKHCDLVIIVKIR